MVKCRRNRGTKLLSLIAQLPPWAENMYSCRKYVFWSLKHKGRKKSWLQIYHLCWIWSGRRLLLGAWHVWHPNSGCAHPRGRERSSNHVREPLPTAFMLWLLQVSVQELCAGPRMEPVRVGQRHISISATAPRCRVRVNAAEVSAVRCLAAFHL